MSLCTSSGCCTGQRERRMRQQMRAPSATLSVLAAGTDRAPEAQSRRNEVILQVPVCKGPSCRRCWSCRSSNAS